MFITSCKNFLKENQALLFFSIGKPLSKKQTRKTKTRYVCGACGQEAWAKPEANLMCGDCRVVMKSTTP